MKYFKGLIMAIVFLGLLSLQNVGEPITGEVSNEGYSCSIHLRFPIIETDQHYLTISDHSGPNSLGKLSVHLFDKDLTYLDEFKLKGYYLGRKSLSHPVLESLFLNAQGVPCVLYSKIVKDKALIMMAQIDIANEELINPTQVMEVDVPKASLYAWLYVRHSYFDGLHKISILYYKKKFHEREEDRQYSATFNANFEPETERNSKGPNRILSMRNISSKGRPDFLPITWAIQRIKSTSYLFTFSSTDGAHNVNVAEGVDKGDRKEVASIALGQAYTAAKCFYSEAESTLTFVAFKYGLDEKDRYKTIEGLVTCRLDATDFHLIDETTYKFTKADKSKILRDIDKFGNSTTSEKDIAKGISPYKFSVKVEFFDSKRFVLLLRETIEKRTTTADATWSSSKYNDLIYIGYSGKESLDFVNRVYVADAISYESSSNRINTYRSNGQLHLLYKDGQYLTHRVLQDDGTLVDAGVDKAFAEATRLIHLDLQDVDLKPGTHVVGGNRDRKLFLARITLP